MATLVGGYSQGNGNQNFFTFLTASSGPPVAGDLLFLFTMCEAGRDVATPAGWTLYQNVVAGSGRMVLFTRTATGTEVNQAVSLTTAGFSRATGSLINCRPSAGEAIDDMDFQADATWTPPVATVPSLSPSGAGGLLICFMATCVGGGGAGSVAMSVPPGMATYLAIGGSHVAGSMVTAAFYETVAGPTGPRTSTPTGTPSGDGFGWGILVATPVLLTGEGWSVGAILLPS